VRLYLSSFLLGNKPEELVALAGAGRRCAVVLNALDNRQDVRDRFRASQTEAIAKLGFATEELDLRTYFGRAAELRARLAQADVLWINGGNAFILRRAMKQSGFDRVIRDLLAKDEIVYAGFSAATVLAAPDLHGLEIIDDPHDVPPGYAPEIVWDGLGLVEFAIAVHYKSDHRESPLTDKEIEYYEARGTPYRTLRDGEALVVQGSAMRIVG
jgi:dipeptidase E